MIFVCPSRLESKSNILLQLQNAIKYLLIRNIDSSFFSYLYCPYGINFQDYLLKIHFAQQIHAHTYR